MYEKLKKLINVDNATKAVHIESINERYKNKVSDVTRESVNYFNPISAENEKPVAAETSEENLMRCPICTGELVLRTAKRGANAGNNFYGCSNYPKCKHIRNA